MSLTTKIFLFGLAIKTIQFLVWFLQVEYYKLTGVQI